MATVNKVILVGHLGADPELRYTTGGQPVCKFRIATTRRWKDAQGQQQEDTCWHRIVSWGKQGELCQNYLRKGRQVYVEGRLSQSKYEDTQGIKRWSTEVVTNSVVFLGSRDGSSSMQAPRAHESPPSYREPPPPPVEEPEEEELPF